MAGPEGKPSRRQASEPAEKKAAAFQTLKRHPRPTDAQEGIDATVGSPIVLQVNLGGRKKGKKKGKKGRRKNYADEFTWDTDIPITELKKRKKPVIEWDTTGVEPGDYAISVTVTEWIPYRTLRSTLGFDPALADPTRIRRPKR